MKKTTKNILGLLLCGFALTSAIVAKADVQYTVTVNTSVLAGSSSGAGPFYIDFQLSDGSQSGDTNNTVTLSNFTYGGGSATGSSTVSGGASGSLSSGVSITDSTALGNEFYQGFTPGSTLTFTLNSTTDLDAGLTPDGFSFAILDGNLENIPTTGPGDSLVLLNFNGTWVLQDYNSSSVIGNTGISTLGVTAVPEPSSVTMSVIGLAGFVAFSLRRKFTNMVR